jgi:hypothetical protein
MSDITTPTTSQIPPDDRPHRPADDREEIYFEGSPRLRASFGKFFVIFIVGLVLIAVPPFFKQYITGWGVLAGVVIGVVLIVVPVLMQKTERYRISNYRIDFERGILGKNIDTLELWHVEDIKFHQSLLDRILDVGTITILSHDDTTPRLDLFGLPQPRPIFEQLKQRVIAVKRQRGVIKMDTGA